VGGGKAWTQHNRASTSCYPPSHTMQPTQLLATHNATHPQNNPSPTLTSRPPQSHPNEAQSAPQESKVMHRVVVHRIDRQLLPVMEDGLSHDGARRHHVTVGEDDAARLVGCVVRGGGGGGGGGVGCDGGGVMRVESLGGKGALLQ